VGPQRSRRWAFPALAPVRLQRPHPLVQRPHPLMQRPQVLFLDEPTTGLDPEACADMWLRA
jgi:ABC-type arginine transport system ATPase subunit